MKLFLSWSGPVSHELADVLHSWFPGVLPAVQPWLASEDIPKGAPWSDVVANALKTADFGILCIVDDNVDAPWLNYEAGALASSRAASKVAPVLFGLPLSRVTGPLRQFQLTVFERRDVFRLLQKINSELEDRALRDATLVHLFDKLWPGLAQSVEALVRLPAEPKNSNYSQDHEVGDFEQFYDTLPLCKKIYPIHEELPLIRNNHEYIAHLVLNMTRLKSHLTKLGIDCPDKCDAEPTIVDQWNRWLVELIPLIEEKDLEGARRLLVPQETNPNATPPWPYS